MQIHIAPNDGLPIYLQIVNQVKYLVASGRLSPGDELPAIRVLAERLLVNPNTVARVYTELEREGVLNTRPGLGVFVAQPRNDLTRRVRKDRLLSLIDELLTEAVHLGFSADEVQAMLGERISRFAWPQPVGGD